MPEFHAINPATGERLRTYQTATPEEVDQTLERASRAFATWRERPQAERADLLRRVAAELRANKDALAALMTAEMGKPIGQAEGEIEKCAWNCDFYADEGGRFLAPETRDTSATESYVAFEPLGTVLAIMPWNFPFWQVLRFAAPALMAGNTAILKHAPNVPGCAEAIVGVFRAAGLPDGVFQSLPLPNEDVAAVIADARVHAVTLTGSERAGMQVAAESGQALKKTVLELGGSDPFIVLADADLAAAAAVGANARNQNSGQSCIAAKRFIVDEAVAGAFTELLVAEVAKLRTGDPADRAVHVGPLARADLRENLERQVRDSVAMGAKVALGGGRIEGPGFFYAPTVLTEVRPGMPAADEETFGPVAAVMHVPDEDAAITLANATRYGLGAALWTRDVERAKRLATRIDAGAVFINGMVASDPRLPFGGVKRSGYGRELDIFGIREFVNVKAVWVGPAR